MSDNTNTVNTDNTIYKDFCDGMKNQAREQVRLAGDIARRVSKGNSLPSRQPDLLQTSISNFIQLGDHLQNIENNINKVYALTRSYK